MYNANNCMNIYKCIGRDLEMSGECRGTSRNFYWQHSSNC